jgi:hypothetical protein
MPAIIKPASSSCNLDSGPGWVRGGLFAGMTDLLFKLGDDCKWRGMIAVSRHAQGAVKPLERSSELSAELPHLR